MVPRKCCERPNGPQLKQMTLPPLESAPQRRALRPHMSTGDRELRDIPPTPSCSMSSSSSTSTTTMLQTLPQKKHIDDSEAKAPSAQPCTASSSAASSKTASKDADYGRLSMLSGLKTTELNGQLCRRLLHIPAHNGRVAVRLESSGKDVLVKMVNLQLCNLLTEDTDADTEADAILNAKLLQW
eukprot:CAMPEP_0172677688 /NCGR_PEP_ID=MMETSP1074-20121228/14850_1 /TAXON_ID=2916 /ORGANISM="Ceratium fusus, Strain PA161109" /LENGTH=183 /DNA_ID=CAMNT_0013495569 /DNA_START=347 /DNA_END=895 /DNA_ORIENTATION=-